mgnify:CR=1 FL=1
MLELTPKEITERKGLVINPAKTCQPIGAMLQLLELKVVCLIVMVLKGVHHTTECT